MTPPLTTEKDRAKAIESEGKHGFVRRLSSQLGPGLITGASDDDPSGIATYSQISAQFGYSLLWTMLLSYPLMAAIQEICGRIGRVTGCGLAANLRKNYPRPLLLAVLLLMSAANVFNLGADIGAMGSSAALIVPGKDLLLTIAFGIFSLLTIFFIPYTTYAKYLKWLTLSLFAYFGVAFLVHVSWREVASATLIPHVGFSRESFVALVAVFGTTISPYLFFWQASQEAEEVKNNRGEKALKRAPSQAPAQLERIHADTLVGMAFSNIVVFLSSLPPRPRCTHTASRIFPPARRPHPPWNRLPAASPACSLSAGSWAPVCSRCPSWLRQQPTASPKVATGRRALRTNQRRRRDSTAQLALRW